MEPDYLFLRYNFVKNKNNGKYFITDSWTVGYPR